MPSSTSSSDPIEPAEPSRAEEAAGQAPSLAAPIPFRDDPRAPGRAPGGPPAPSIDRDGGRDGGRERTIEPVEPVETVVPSDAAGRSFFGPAMVLLVSLLAGALALGRVAGAALELRRPPPVLLPSAAEIARTSHTVVVLGNSRFEAGIDPAALAVALDPTRGAAPADSGGVDARLVAGGGWNAFHYLALASLARPDLRPGADAVVIEVSPLSLDEASPDDRLWAVPVAQALDVARTSGMPLEARLDLALGAVAGLYRYRPNLETAAVWPRLDAAATSALSRVGLVGPERRPAPFQLVTAPGRDFVIAEIRGDREAFTAVNRRKLEAQLGSLRVGGAKTAALDRAVGRLRDAGVAVHLVETPVSRWFAAQLRGTEVHRQYRATIDAIALRHGAHAHLDWPDALSDDARFWDETHMVAAATSAFTREAAARISAAGAW